MTFRIELHHGNYMTRQKFHGALDMTRMTPDDPSVTLGALLGREAQRREISHEAAAEIIGVSQATFSRWVNDENLPTSPYWTKVARFLSVPREQIVEIAQRPAPKREIVDRLATVEQRIDELMELVEKALRRRR